MDLPLSGHEFEEALGDGEGQGSLSCCSPQGRKQSDTTERLNNFGICKAFSFFDYPRERGENPQELRLTSCQSGIWLPS